MIRLTLPQAMRQGTSQSGSFTVPAAGLSPHVIVRPLIRAQDLAETTLSLILNFQTFDPVLGVWRHLAGADWRGGRPAPAIDLPVANLTGKSLRVALDVPVSMRVGATLEDADVGIPD